MKRSLVKGISVCNPVDLDRDYLLYTADYAIEHNFDHYQFIGPIHNPDKGNIDGMIFYRKYAQFNNEKTPEYVRYCVDVVNEICDKLVSKGIKTYMWHHELEVPAAFTDTFPEIRNDYGDVEITHPLIKDFLENKIEDFFYTYPKMDGIILTLHETRIPLLKLKNQKLDKIERVKYVTEILYKTCKKLGKELIVRPFASIEEDYEMMTNAYEQISTDMVIMDKWTQFDWSLTLPENAFFKKIKHNPLLVETDIFGEYFGKGFLPIMLKDHIKKNYAHCENFSPWGYVSRIDRMGYHPFGSVNEVNLPIMEACLCGRDVDKEIDEFFAEKYPNAAKEVRALMENTEDIQKKIFYLNGYYYSDQSLFPRWNHSKNHFYLEMMKDEYEIASNEWFIPKNWVRGPLSDVLKEKQQAVEESEQKLKELALLQAKLPKADYDALEEKFLNLYYVAKLWQELTNVFLSYAKYFEKKDDKYEAAMYTAMDNLIALDAEGREKVGENFYAAKLSHYPAGMNAVCEFVQNVKDSFAIEKESILRLEKEALLDYIVCGGGTESHKLQKEVNFSDTYITADGLCRIPGTNRGKKFSVVNAHGWFSYEIKVRPNAENRIAVVAVGSDGQLDYTVTINGENTTVKQTVEGKTENVFTFVEKEGKDRVRIRIDRISGYTPYIYEIKVYN